MLTQEEIFEIKKQLLTQIENFPEDKKLMARQQIENMDDSELEEFLERNNLIREQKCIFCSIINGEIPSFKIDEDENSIAVLEINPVSEGHILIIPKNHEGGISDKEISFARKLGEKVKNNLKSKDLIMAKSSLMNHEILNLIPVYKKETMNSERKKASQEELIEIQKILTEKEKPKKEELKKEKTEEIKIEKKPLKEEKIRLPKRIP